MCGIYPMASSLWSSAFLAFLTSVELAFLVTGGVYSLNLLFGAPQTAKIQTFPFFIHKKKEKKGNLNLWTIRHHAR